MLDQVINRYTNQALSAAEVIAALVGLARDMRDAKPAPAISVLAGNELAFYDSVCENDSAILEMVDDILRASHRQTQSQEPDSDFCIRQPGHTSRIGAGAAFALAARTRGGSCGDPPSAGISAPKCR
ncbi:DUF3387 domain-containing protein [Iamia sp. SCSIO 61187]|nr:DUF3387 domain-containing protein [Iamia sp. SCSIO 61187]